MEDKVNNYIKIMKDTLESQEKEFLIIMEQASLGCKQLQEEYLRNKTLFNQFRVMIAEGAMKRLQELTTLESKPIWTTKQTYVEPENVKLFEYLLKNGSNYQEALNAYPGNWTVKPMDMRYIPVIKRQFNITNDKLAGELIKLMWVGSYVDLEKQVNELNQEFPNEYAEIQAACNVRRNELDELVKKQNVFYKHIFEK